MRYSSPQSKYKPRVKTYQRCRDGSVLEKYYTDGGCKANGREWATGVIVACNSEGKILFDIPLKAGWGGYERITCNVAELEAVRALLVQVPEDKDILISTDSTIIKNWVKRGRVGKLAKHCARSLADVMKLIKDRSGKFGIVWERRDKNLAGIYIEGRYGL